MSSLKIGQYARPASVLNWKLSDYRKIVSIGENGGFIKLEGDNALYFPAGLVYLDDEQTRLLNQHKLECNLIKQGNAIMSTVYDAVKQIIQTASAEELRALGYDETNVYDVYMSEYGNHNGLEQSAVKEYCMGLPNIFTFPFYNWEIIDLLSQHGITRKSEKAQLTLVDQYWQAIGAAAYQILKQAKKEHDKEK